MMLPVELAAAIAHDARCMWQALSPFLRGVGTRGHCLTARECYRRLQARIREYEDRGLTLLEPHELWFAQTMIESYDDLTSRNIVK